MPDTASANDQPSNRCTSNLQRSVLSISYFDRLIKVENSEAIEQAIRKPPNLSVSNFIRL